MIKSYRAVAVTIALGFSTVLMLPTTVIADVTVTRATHFGGIMGLGASNNTSTEYIKGKEKRYESTMRFTGSILSKFGGAHSSVVIYRVDKGRIISLNTARHTYTVLPMTADNAEAASNTHQSGSRDSERQRHTKSDTDHTRVVRNELTVQATGKRNTINGYRCKEYLMKWLVVTENTRTKSRSKSVMTSNIWATPETRSLHILKDAELAYNSAYLKHLGMTISPQQQQQFGLSMLGFISGRNRHDLKRALGKIHGYPISISVKWRSDAQGDESGNSESANGEAALKRAAGNIGGLLSGMFHSSKTANQQTPTGMRTIFSSTTEIMKINTAAVPAQLFEVPRGYHKVSY